MKKRDTYKSYIYKKIFGVDSTYYKPNPKFTRADQVPTHLALIIDGVVEDIIHCDERLGYILMSDPDIVELGDDFYKINISDIYDKKTGNFYKELKNV